MQTRQPVAAWLHDELGALDLLDAEIAWMPERMKAIARMLREGIPEDELPQHSHWNWWNKAYELRMLATGGFGIQCGRGPVRNPKVLVRIAAALGVEGQPLLELAGLITTTDERLGKLAAQFSARLETVKPLEPDEEQALGWFKEQAFRPRSKSVAS